MAFYTVTTYQSSIGTLAEVLTAIDTQLATIDTGKTLRHIEIKPVGNNPKIDEDAWVGVLIYDT